MHLQILNMETFYSNTWIQCTLLSQTLCMNNRHGCGQSVYVSVRRQIDTSSLTCPKHSFIKLQQSKLFDGCNFMKLSHQPRTPDAHQYRISNRPILQVFKQTHSATSFWRPFTLCLIFLSLIYQRIKISESDISKNLLSYIVSKNSHQNLWGYEQWRLYLWKKDENKKSQAFLF